jgi:hypothetical protein
VVARYVVGVTLLATTAATDESTAGEATTDEAPTGGEAAIAVA